MSSRSSSPRTPRRPAGPSRAAATGKGAQGPTPRRPRARHESEAPSREKERPKRFGAGDEPFWLHQEAQLTNQLGQPCCSVSGVCTLLGQISGPLAVILHGERDCGNSFVHQRLPAPHRFFTTGVTEEEATSGRVDAPLAECLRLVLDEVAPSAVLVLHTCLLSMIGSDPRRIIDEVVKETGTSIPVVYLDTSGLRLGSQADMADRLYSTLAALPQHPPRDTDWQDRWITLLERERQNIGRALQGAEDPAAGGPERCLATLRDAATPWAPSHSVNVIGVDRLGMGPSEAIKVFRQLGVRIVGIFPMAAPLHQWQSISSADLNVVLDVRLYPLLLRQLEQGYGIETLEVPLPTGLAQTDQFYALLGERLGLGARLEDALAPYRQAASIAVETFRKRVRGLRLALGLRMLNNYAADQLAYDGLGDLMALEELGFEVTLFVQGPPEADRRFKEMLSALGCQLPILVFPSPWNLGRLLADGGFDVAYLPDHAAEEARKAGVPMLKSRSLDPFYAGVSSNLVYLSELLELAGREPVTP